MSGSVARICAWMLAFFSLTMRLMSRSTPGTFLCTLRMRCAAATGARVHQIRALPHHRDIVGADHVARLRRSWDVRGDGVRSAQERLEARAGADVPEGELAPGVEERAAHALRLGEDADLRADVAVADDAEGLATDLHRSGGHLAP